MTQNEAHDMLIARIADVIALSDHSNKRIAEHILEVADATLSEVTLEMAAKWNGLFFPFHAIMADRAKIA